MRQYFIHDGEQQKGPFSLEELSKIALAKQSFVWYQGLSDWTPIQDIYELRETISKSTIDSLSPTAVPSTKNIEADKQPKNEQQVYLYSKKAIMAFSILVTPLLGCLLISSNMKKLGKSQGRIEVVAMGIMYFFTMILIAFNVPEKTPNYIFIGINVGVSQLMINHYWKQYIGEQIVYLSKPIWKPLIFSILFVVFYIALIAISL